MINKQKIKFLTFLFRTTFLIWILPSFVFSQNEADLFKGEIIDMNACNFRFEVLETGKNIKTEKEKFKAKEGEHHLIMVKMQGKIPESGIFTYYESMFSIVFSENGRAKIAPSRAVGEKFKTKSGEIKEVWAKLSRGHHSLVSSPRSAGKDVILYVIFEIPVDVKSFKIQIPAISENEVTINGSGKNE